MSSRIFFVIVSLFLSFSITAQIDDEVLMKVGDSDVKVSEFKYIYEKNNGAHADYSKSSLDEYLDLYTKFKLKVEKAQQLQLDTIGALKTELEGYRKQLASSYLIDKEVTDFLLKELYGRMQYDIDFSHIFVPVPENSTQAVKDAAIATLKDVRSKISGGMTFEDAAKQFSQDKTTAPQGGEMGYFTAKLPNGFYDLETAIYNTKDGQVSDIVKSKIGYHLVKVNAHRPAKGTIEIAHILLNAEKKNLVDSLYAALNAGADFEQFVSKYSQDKASSKNGGKLAPFGIGTYDKKFEDAAFRLSNDGDITLPIMTKSGWHIIKRISKPKLDSYDIFVRKMKSQINKDSRFDSAKVKLISDIKKSSNFTENRSELNSFKSTLTDEFYSYKWSPNDNISTNTLFTFGKNNNYTVKNFGEFCKKNTKTRLKYDKTKPLGEVVDELYDEYVNSSAMDFEEKSLESKYPDFKSLMREYEEGILLFEATKINVWDKANQDTVGLQAYYETSKDHYKWDEKAKVEDIKLLTSDQKLADQIYAYAAKNSASKIESKFNKKTKVVQIASLTFEKSAKEMANLKWAKNAVSPLDFNGSANTYSFKKILDIEPSRVKTLSEARGYVVADYQDFLEKKWMEELSKEFKVELNQQVVEKLRK